MKILIPKKRIVSFQHFSIQQRLPLLICILLLCIIVAVSFGSYVGVKKTSLATAGERLRLLTEQLSSMFALSLGADAINTQHIAGMEPVKKYLLSGGAGKDTMALSALRKLQTDTQSLFVEMLDLKQRLILRVGRPEIKLGLDRKSVLSDLQVGADSCKIGKIYRASDSMFYPIVATVTHNRQIIGHIIRWRLIFATSQALEQFSGLLGTDAALYIGNVDGTAWTDMIRPVTAPPVDSMQDNRNYYSYSRANVNPVIAFARPVANTKWLLLLEFSQQKILEGTKRFLSWILIIGAVITAIGITMAWIMSRNITRPLKKLTAAATAVASGNYDASVEVDRKDELGELARAFNSMAVQINNAHQHLEQKVSERTAELEMVNKELEAFSYSVSHDLRAPLRAISGYAVILKEDYAEKLDAEACRLTDTIISNAKMMGQLIDDLIDFSKTGAKKITDQRVKMKTLAESSVVELLSHETANKYQIHISNLPDCRGDHNLFRQVWLNLIGNAIKYSSRIENPSIEIGSKEDSSSYTYYIRDNGVCFDMQYADKLFGVFQRLHSDDVFKGTGIGLALVKRIINKYNGNIWAEAEPGKGAAFYFSLPK